MANTFITPTWVTKDTALFWDNNLKLVGQFDRQWDESFKNKPEGAQIGDTVQVRLPQRWTVTEGQALQQQAILNQTTPITLNHQQNVAMGWSSVQSTLYVEEVRERYTMPAGKALANKCDVTAGAEVYKSVYYQIGSPQTALSDNQTWVNAVAMLQNVGVPQPYCAVVDPLTQAAVVPANFALFNLPGNKDIFQTGQFASGALGIDEWYYDPNIPTFTTGSFTASTWAVNAASQTGSTLAVDGAGTYALVKGDTFYIDGVYAVNPLSYVTTGQLQAFVLTADVAGSSTATLSFSPSIITSGQLQTVTGSPADNAAITFVGATGTVAATMTATTSRQSLVFNPKAFGFVMADLAADLAGAKASRYRDPDVKVSMRWVEQYNIQTDQNPRRVDVIYGVAPIEPYFALRAWS